MEPFFLEQQLRQYASANLTPLHMPGHKRRMAPAPGLPYACDVTEVLGTDDLHEASGILAQAMARTAQLYGAKRTWYLVNGSTCGLLAGIRALAPAGSEIIAARNCHKSVYHAIELGGLNAHWLVPQPVFSFGIYGSISPEAVSIALSEHPQARCVVVTSPTYEGIISDIAAIAAICHHHGVPLLVDEAHGAHLGLPCSGMFPSGAVQSGADLVVQSAHKTLPSLTQTAWLHCNGNSALQDEIERQLDIFETSSPSYPLLASLDGCTGILQEQGSALFSAWAARLSRFYSSADQLKNLHVLGGSSQQPLSAPEIYAFDKSKLLVSGRGTRFTGFDLAQALRTRFGFETEMACGENVLAMTSPCDAPDTLDRFLEALLELDQDAIPAFQDFIPAKGFSVPFPDSFPSACTISHAVTLPSEEISPQAAPGRICGEYVWAYPPGVPLVAPGEIITAELLECLGGLSSAGTPVHHSRAQKGGFQCLSG